MTAIFMFFKLGIVILIAVVVFELTRRSKYLMLDVLFIGFLFYIYEWLMGATIQVALPFIRLNITDIICIYLLCMTIFLRRKPVQKSIKISWLIMTFFFGLGMIRGFAINPFTDVIEDVRRLITIFIVPIGCMSVLPFDINDVRVKKRIKQYSFILIVFCMVSWMLDIVFGIHLVNAQSDSGSTMRVLRAEQALVLSFFAVGSLCNDLARKSKKIRRETIVLFLTVILLQHRTVWAAVALGVAFLLLVAKKDSTSMKHLFSSKKFLIQLAYILVICFVIFFTLRNSLLMKQLAAGIEGFSGGDGTTLDYRIQLWTGHLSALTSVEWLIGKPFGSGYYVVLEKYARDLTPHSAFIQTIIRTGLFGLASVIVFFDQLFRVSKIKKYVLGEVICVMLLVFYFGYTYNFYSSIVVGILIRTISNIRLARSEINEYN